MSVLTLLAGAESLDGSVSPLLGIVALRLKCHAPDLLTAISGTVPSVGVGLVENQPRSFSRDVSGDQGGYIVGVTLEGCVNPATATGQEFSLDGTTGQEPIDTSPRLPLLREVYRFDRPATKKEGRTIWPATLSGEEGEQRNPMHGVDVFRAAGLIWTHRWVSPILPRSIVRGLGYINQPPGNPPELDGNRNWLKVRARATWRGNVWEIEESWELSDVGGWVSELYRPE
jgi:hypothetical protein